MIKSINWITEKRNINELKPATYNPRKWNEIATKNLSKSLDKFNLAEPIIINKDNTVIGGHFRLKILKEQRKNKEIACRVPTRLLTEKEEKELNIRLNKNTGDWDFELLSSNFDEAFLKDVGFDSLELDKIFKPEEIQFDDPGYINEERKETITITFFKVDKNKIKQELNNLCSKYEGLNIYE